MQKIAMASMFLLMPISAIGICAGAYAAIARADRHQLPPDARPGHALRARAGSLPGRGRELWLP